MAKTVVPGRKPKLLVGNEGWGYAELIAGPYDPILYQTFSLPGQPRDRSAALKDVLSDCGLKSGRKIGAIGWKPFVPEDHGFGETAYRGQAIPRHKCSAGNFCPDRVHQRLCPRHLSCGHWRASFKCMGDVTHTVKRNCISLLVSEPSTRR